MERERERLWQGEKGICISDANVINLQILFVSVLLFVSSGCICPIDLFLVIE